LNYRKKEIFPEVHASRQDWPWSDEYSFSSGINKTDRYFPRITVVTPSYNQGLYLEETIRSVILQGYPNLEYIVMDGGSTDNSVSIIQKYDQFIDYWTSQPDRGQAFALNRGFAKSSGELLGWINSDDILLPGAFFELASAFNHYFNHVLVGDVVLFSENGDYKQRMKQRGVTFKNLVQVWNLELRWSQPGTYFSREIWEQSGPFHETFRYVFDRDFLCRVLQHYPVHYIEKPIARFRLHDSSKTVSEAPDWLDEHVDVTRRYWDKVPGLDKNVALAELEVWYGALPHMSVLKYRFNRKLGIQHLIKAVRYHWKIILSIRFLILCLVSLTPFWVLQKARKYVSF
jgi:glycosyltransferase involved in cell wall biosynthesis